MPEREYQRPFLAGPFGVETYQAIQELGRQVGEERRTGVSPKKGKKKGAVSESRQRKKKKTRRTIEEEEALPDIPWVMEVQDPEGEMALVRFKESRVTPWVTSLVPVEWANEMLRWAGAVQKEIKRIVSGQPLKLDYPPSPSAASARFQGSRAAIRGGSSQRPAGGTITLSMLQGRRGHTSSAGASVETSDSTPTPRRSSRLRTTQGESSRKRPRDDESAEEVESSRGDGDDSVSDEHYRVEPSRFLTDTGDDDDDEDGSDDVDEDTEGFDDLEL